MLFGWNEVDFVNWLAGLDLKGADEVVKVVHLILTHPTQGCHGII
jgi:hypothetical protein